MKSHKRLRAIWQIALRKSGEADFRYIQTQRHQRPPAIGDTVSVRDVEGDGPHLTAVVETVTMQKIWNGFRVFNVEVAEMNNGGG